MKKYNRKNNWKTLGEWLETNVLTIGTTKGLALYFDTDVIGYSCATTNPGNEKQKSNQNRKQN